VEVHREIRKGLTSSVPLWPLGLPAWNDPWLSLALRSGDVTHVAVWRRGNDTGPVTLSLPHLRSQHVHIEARYPLDLPAWTVEWDTETGCLTLTPTPHTTASARLFRILAG
jgi:alpha-galactosidase